MNSHLPAHRASSEAVPVQTSAGLEGQGLSLLGLHALHVPLFQKISAIAVSSLDAARIAEQATRAIHAHFSTQFVTTRLANRERTRLRIVALEGLPDDYMASAGILSVEDDHIVCDAFRSGAPIYGRDVTDHPAGHALARTLAEYDVHPAAYLVLPLLGRTSAVGVVTIGWLDPQPFAPPDLEAFASLANVFATGVENAYLYEDERAAAAIARRLSVTSQQLAAEFEGIFQALTDAVVVVDPSEVITRANASAVRLFGFNPTTMPVSLLAERAELRDRDNQPLRPHTTPYRLALGGATAHEAPFTFERDGTLVRVLVGAAPIISHGIVSAAVTVWRDTTERDALVESLASERERMEGILASITDGFAFIDRDATFRSANTSFLTMFGLPSEQVIGKPLSSVFDEGRTPDILHALTAALTYERSSAFVYFYAPADLWAEVRVYPAHDGTSVFVTDVSTRRRAELEREQLLTAYRMELARTALLKDIATTAGSTLSVEEICRLVLDTVCAHLDPVQGMLHLSDETGSSLLLVSQFGLGHVTPSPTRSFSRAASALLQSAEPLMTHDNPGPAWPDAEIAHELRWIVVPIRSVDRPLGTLSLAFEGRRPFSTEEVSLFRSIAGHLTIALENARLFQREHRIADTLQQSLLAESTHVTGIETGRVYRPATEHVRVGGDFYDVYQLPNGFAGITIGDVSGKGVPAASLTALIRNAIRTLALDGQAPHDVMRRADRVLHHFSDDDMFVTAVFGVLDPVTGTFSYSNAGHPPPLLVRGDGSVAALGAGGPVLGALHGATYSGATLTLNHGDVLVFYTDGVTEARNSGVFFGEEGLGRLLTGLTGMSADQIAQSVVDAAWAWGGGTLRDDVAVLAIRLRQLGADHESR